MDPIIYFGIDNCFASKRWIRPEEWMRIIHGLGIKYVEASADTECDPLYMGCEFLADWAEDVRAHQGKWDIGVRSLYSGHGTYATSGLTHYDRRVILRFRDEWMKKQMDIAASLGAGFGFFAHGFEELLLQDEALYQAKLDELYDTLADLAVYGQKIGISGISLEQMYTPHMPPWTIRGAGELLREVYRRGGSPFYLTLDLGHMNGQQYFQKPDAQRLRDWIDAARQGTPPRRVWVGSDAAGALYERAIAGQMETDAAVDAILADVEAHSHLFARPEDGSVTAWLRALGAFSPIVHLQQSDGKSSPHWPFSEAFNRKGIIRGGEVLRALAESFNQPDVPGMPPRCREVTLTLEPFISTAGSTRDLMEDLKASVAYWRSFVPRDGMRLSEIVKNLAD